MHTQELCHKWLSDVLPQVHCTRLTALAGLVGSAIRGGRLTVTGLGRALNGPAKVKHSIKKADRLCSNPRLQAETFEIYRQIAHHVLGTNWQPVILVDWSDIDERRKFFLLRAAVAVGGRSLTLYEEVHERETKERRKTHAEFLRKLKKILPAGCRPILITDAGFRAPWFKNVRALGWDFIGRVRNRELVRLEENEPWISAKILYERATGVARCFMNAALTRSNTLRCSLVLFKGRAKGRKRLTRMGRISRSRTSLVNATRSREPWLLATSLPAERASAKKVVLLYAMRMQIEESFRDLKCPRFGLSLLHNGTYKLVRMRILVLIGSIAAIFAWLLGRMIRATLAHRQYQANTVTTVNVLSNFFLGIQAFREARVRVAWRIFTATNSTLSPSGV